MSAETRRDIPPLFLPQGAALVDTHCHLDMEDYGGDLGEVLAAAAGAGVKKVLTVGVDPASSRRAVALAEAHEGVYAAVGVHPHNVDGVGSGDYEAVRGLASHPKVVAWGEIGMDRVKEYAPAGLQKEHFRRQLRLARDAGLPVIIHDREAHADILAILREEAPFPAGGVMHCFSGNVALAREVTGMGFFVSIPGVVTFSKAATLREVVREIPLSWLLLETDGPFLAPEPRRGKRNEPAFLVYTAMKVAEIKGVDLAEVARRTTANATRLFGLQADGC